MTTNELIARLVYMRDKGLGESPVYTWDPDNDLFGEINHIDPNFAEGYVEIILKNPYRD